MADLVTVIHGTSHSFEAEIEDHGLRVRPGKSRGTRVSLTRELATVHAAAFCAYVMMAEQLPPIALLCTATIERNRITEGVGQNPLTGLGFGPNGEMPVVGPSLVVPGGIRAEELTLEQIKLPMLFDAEAARRALVVFERLTDRKVALVPGNVE
jgi:hypothetical protein